MSRHTHQQGIRPQSDLLGMFTGRNRGFQVPGRSSYQKHEQWRNDVFRGLKELEADGLIVVQQLIPCQRHRKCCGKPVAAGCELSPAGRHIRIPVTPYGGENPLQKPEVLPEVTASISQTVSNARSFRGLISVHLQQDDQASY
jgi:hypothetical protein